MRRRDTPPTPLQRGGLKCLFLISNEEEVTWLFPLSRGDKGVCDSEEHEWG